MREHPLVLAVDGGGTTSKAAIFDADGSIMREKTIGPLSCKSSGKDAVASSIGEMLEFIGEDSTSIEAAVLGLSGLDSPEDVSAMVGLLAESGMCLADSKPRAHAYGTLCESTWGFPLLLCSDALIPLFANGLEEGTVVISGTGSVALRIGKRGAIERFGGWGYMTSDEGSGCWIGIELMREALHVADELLSGKVTESKLKASSKSLLECAFSAARAQSGSRVSKNASLNQKATFIREWATAHDDPKDYASLARWVTESSSASCRGIRERAAAKLAWLASLACTDDAPVVVLSGGVFSNERFAALTVKAIRDAVGIDGLRVIVNEAHPAFGAFALARHAL